MIVPQKHHPSHRVRRRIGWGLLAVLLAYALAALIPCAFPPQLSAAEVADTAWMETEASDLNTNRGMLITTGQEAMETRLALIASAQSSIDLGSYIYAPDESGRKITAALLAAADRGVRVRLITDGLIGWINLGNDPLGPALGSHPNVEIKFYNPIDISRPQGLNARYHEKFFLVDDTWLLLGGRNVSDEFLTGEGDPSYNYDQDVLLYRLDRPSGTRWRRCAATLTPCGRPPCARCAMTMPPPWSKGPCASAGRSWMPCGRPWRPPCP